MRNIYRQVYGILLSKTYREMTSEEIELVNKVEGFVANTLPRIFPKYDTLPISEGLLFLARLVESSNEVSKGENNLKAQSV